MKKQIKQLFVQDLAQVKGGTTTQVVSTKCPEYTTLACGEEPVPQCSAC